MRWVYVGREDGSPAVDIVRVADRVKVIDGIPCAVVLDRVYHRGRLVERTTDWDVPAQRLQTRETTPADPGVVDRKLYVRGIGQILEASVKGGSDRLALVAFRDPRPMFTG